MSHPKGPAPAFRPSILRRLRLFRRDEDGGMIIFGLFVFLITLMIGGMAVDVARFEMARVRLQTAIDRAVLAAADLDQTVDPQAVVEDYLTKAGVRDFLVSTNVSQGLNFREVSVSAKIELPMMFMKLIGINQLEAPATATATEAVSDIEISLVLDISGSMDGHKLRELKTAAIAFVEDILSRSEPDTISINIVPYSTQVSLPASLIDNYRFDREHDFSSCVDFDESDFDTVAIDPRQKLTQTQHFDPFNTWGPAIGGNRLFVCRPDEAAKVMALEGDLNDLRAKINSLTAGGNTSIEIGVKWGAALLDPAARGPLSNLSLLGLIDAIFSGRPFDFDRPQVLKVLVVMTDGINTTQYWLDDKLRHGYSDVYRDRLTGDIWVSSQERGDRDNDGRWNERWYSPERRIRGYSNYWRRSSDIVYGTNSNAIPPTLERLDYNEMYDEVSFSYNYYYNWYQQAYDYDDYYDWYYAILNGVDGGDKDDRMETICNAAKAEDIVIYTVGFEVTNASATVMEDCASSPSHFFRVAGDELTEAFRAIARQISQLKLTI